MQAMRDKNNTQDVVDGVSTKLLGVLEPMLEQFMTENRRGLQGVRMSIKKDSHFGASGTADLEGSVNTLRSSSSHVGLSSSGNERDLATILGLQGESALSTPPHEGDEV